MVGVLIPGMSLAVVLLKSKDKKILTYITIYFPVYETVYMQMEERQFYHREWNKIWGALQDGKAAAECVCLTSPSKSSFTPFFSVRI